MRQLERLAFFALMTGQNASIVLSSYLLSYWWEMSCSHALCPFSTGSPLLCYLYHRCSVPSPGLPPSSCFILQWHCDHMSNHGSCWILSASLGVISAYRSLTGTSVFKWEEEAQKTHGSRRESALSEIPPRILGSTGLPGLSCLICKLGRINESVILWEL